MSKNSRILSQKNKQNDKVATEVEEIRISVYLTICNICNIKNSSIEIKKKLDIIIYIFFKSAKKSANVI